MARDGNCLIDHTYEIGDLVWAKVKWCKPWPGFVADSKDPKPKKRGNFKWIYFFGYGNYSWINTKMIRPYVPISLDLSKCSKLFRDACATIEDVYKNGKQSKFYLQNRDNTLFNRIVSKAPTKTPEPSTSKGKTSKNQSPPANNSNKVKIEQVQDVSKVSESCKKRGKNPRRVRKNSDANEASSEKKIVKPKKRSSTSAVSEAKRVRTQHSDADTGPTKTPEPSTSKGKTSKNQSPAANNSNKAKIEQVQDVSKVSESCKKRGKNPRRVRKNSDANEASSEKKIVKPKKRSSTSAVSEAKRVRTQHSDADTGPAAMPRRNLIVNPLLDGTSFASPKSVRLDVFKLSQKLLEKNIVPSDLQFGFIGLGNIGSGIVKNLLNSGHRVVIWNRTSKKTKKFINAGATVAETSQDVVVMADITFSCVSDIQAAKDIMFGNCSALDYINETKAYVEMTTIDPETSKLLSDAVTSRGGRYLEAQLQGSRLEAEEGNLLILSAGDQSLCSDCQSCFEAIGRCSFFFGEVGGATKMNLVIQLMSGFFLGGFAEALALSDKLGLHLADVLEVLGLTNLSNPLIQEKGKGIINCSFTTDHALRLMQKDLDLVINMSHTVNQPVPLAAVTNELYKRAKRLGYGDHDSSAVFVATRF